MLRLLPLMLAASVFTGPKPFIPIRTGSVRTDSVPNPAHSSVSFNRYRLGGAFLNSTAPVARTYSLHVRAKALSLGNEIRLPPGYNPSTVRIQVGEKTLVLDEDYVFIPDQNLIRILDEDSLQPDKVLKVTYERLVYHPTN